MNFPVPEFSDDGASADAQEILKELIAIDTTNTGTPQGTQGERAAAEYVAAKLAEVGIESELVDGDPTHPERGRISLIARWPGEDPEQPGLVVHGHLDVVPPGPDWDHDAFAGHEDEDFIHGRGAIDMKGQVAIMLATVREWASQGKKPPRDIVLTFFADEEAGGKYGGQYVTKHHPELFHNCSEVMGLEVGGFSFTLPNGKRKYLLQTAERGHGWPVFEFTGTQAHGSKVNKENPLDRLREALGRIKNDGQLGDEQTARLAARLGTSVDVVKNALAQDANDSALPVNLTDRMRKTLSVLATEFGMEFTEENPLLVVEELKKIPRLKAMGEWLEGSVVSGLNVTQIHGGEKGNTVPGHARVTMDVRAQPGQEESLRHSIEQELGQNVTANWETYLPGWESVVPPDALQAMTASITELDPDAEIIEWTMPAGTDAKAFNQNFPGIPTYGFCPLRMPEEIDIAALFHGKNERIPKSSIDFGVRALNTYLNKCRVLDERSLSGPRIGVDVSESHDRKIGPRSGLGHHAARPGLSIKH